MKKIKACFALLLLGSNAQALELPEFDCLIEPWQRVDISFAAQGILSEVKVEQSQRVEAGQALATLESDLESATLKLREARGQMLEEIRSASASFEFSERNLKRLEDLYKKKAVPFHKVDEAKTELLVNKHRLQQAKDNNRLATLEVDIAKAVLNRRSVVSPINGVVVERYKGVGEYVEDEPIMQLVQLDPLRVRVLVPVSMFGEVELGMNAKIVPEAPMNKTVRSAKVVVVDPVIDVASGSFSVQLEMSNRHLQLPSGLKCGVRFLE